MPLCTITGSLQSFTLLEKVNEKLTNPTTQGLLKRIFTPEETGSRIRFSKQKRLKSRVESVFGRALNYSLTL